MSDRIFEVLASAFLAAHPYVMADSSHLVSILQGCTPRELQEGEILCREGEPGVELYFLLRGVIRVQKAGPDGEPVFLGRVQAPACSDRWPSWTEPAAARPARQRARPWSS